jgi:hypothetical protein
MALAPKTFIFTFELQRLGDAGKLVDSRMLTKN